MRITVDIVGELLNKAIRLAGPMEQTEIVSAALKALMERASAKRLAKKGSTQPALCGVPRRRNRSPA